MATKFFNLDTDTNLGNANASDNIVASQKAIKSYIDNEVTAINGEITSLSTSIANTYATIQALNNLAERVSALEALITKCYMSMD